MATESALINVKQFDRNSFSNWEFRLRLLLEHYEVLKALEMESASDPTKFAKFKKKDTKARNIIVQCIADNILDMIKS